MYYQDDFSRGFKKEEELHEHLLDLDERSWWKRVTNKKMKVLAVDGNGDRLTPVEGEDTQLVAYDTLANTGLMVETGGEAYLLGSTAVPTLYGRARISGAVLSELERKTLADILNECLALSKGKALLYFSEGKIRAMPSGDAGKYSVIQMIDIFMAASAYIGRGFDKTSFTGGYTSHMLTNAAWSIRDTRMMDAYRELLKHYGRNDISDMVTDVRITTSDVTASGVNIAYSIHTGGRTILLGQMLKTVHRGTDGIRQVEEHIQNIFSYYKETLQGVERLMGISIQHPVNTLVGMMHKKFGKKLIAETADNFKSETGDRPCTAYDVYCGICHALVIAQSKGAKTRTLLDLEETISQCITKRWQDYDMPGEVQY